MYKIILFLLLSTILNKIEAQNPFFPVFQDNKWHFIDYSGNKVLEPKVECSLIYPFSPVSKQNTISYAIAKDKSTGLFGYLNTFGQWAIKPTFENVYNFQNGLAIVQLPCDNKCLKEADGLMISGYTRVIDFTGKVILKDQSQNPIPSERYWFNGSNFNGLLSITQGLSVGELKKLMLPNGTIISETYNEMGERIRSGEWMSTRNLNGITYFDANGKKALHVKDISFANDFFGGYSKVSKEVTVGEDQNIEIYFIDKTGKKAVTIPKGYDAFSATDIRSGLYAVQKESDSKYYYLNIAGKEVLGPFDIANRFSNGLAHVLKNDIHFYIDVNGKEIIKPEEDLGYEFDDYQADGYSFLIENKDNEKNQIVGVVLKNGMVFKLN